jgi:outer membrane protein insertion porin family
VREDRLSRGAGARPYLSGVLVGALTALACGAPALGATPEAGVEAVESLYGSRIASVTIEAPPREDLARLRTLAALEPGATCSASALRRAVKLLYELGRFESVRVHARRVEGGVALRLELSPRQVLAEIRLEGEATVGTTAVEEALGLFVGGELHGDALTRAQTKLGELLRRRGHRSAAIGLSRSPTDLDGGQTLLVRIDEGPRTRLRRVVVLGAPRLPLWRVGRWVGLSAGEVLDLDLVDAALERLREAYLERGFLDVKVAPPRVRELDGPDPLADLLIDVDAGPRVTVRFRGNRAVSSRELALDAELLTELGTGPAATGELRERILARYERRGHWRAAVEIAARVTPDREHKELLVSIDEGPASRVASITFPGNDVLPSGTLTELVHEAVGQALLEDLGRPGADPRTLAAAFGDHSLASPRRDFGPSNVAPDPRRIYHPRAYRAAGELIEDAFRAEGYQRVQVERPVVLERAPRAGAVADAALVDVQLPVRPGIRWMVGAVSFAGHEQVSGAELFEVAKLDPARLAGQPLAFTLVEEARRALLAHYRGLGHLYATVSEDLRQVPPRGSLASWGYVSTSTSAPLDVRAVCARAEARGESSCPVEVVFRIHEGPEVKARDVVVRGLASTRAGLVESELAVARGAVLREPALQATRDNLLRLGVFERVTVRPVDEETPAAEKDVVVEVKERRHHALELGVGASTEEGVRAFAGYSDVNLGGTALRLQLQGKLNVWLPQLLLLYDAKLRDRIDTFYDQFGTLGRLEYLLAAGLAYPRIFGLPAGFSAGLDLVAFRDYDPAFAEDTQTVLLMGTYKGLRPLVLGRPRPLAFQLRTKFDRSTLQCNPEINDRPELCSTSVSEQRNLRIAGANAYLGVGPRVSFDLRDDPRDPTRGAFLDVDASYAKGLEANSPDLVALEARASGFVPLSLGSMTFALSFFLGKVFPLAGPGSAGTPDIPVNRRLFSGGRSTIRGYPEKTLLPQDVPLDPISGEPVSSISAGGLLSLALKAELRVPLFSSLSLAVFYDIGDLFESGRFALRTRTALADGRVVVRGLAKGAGAGFRVATPIGPLAVDFAVPVDPRDPGARDPQLHFSVGGF